MATGEQEGGVGINIDGRDGDDGRFDDDCTIFDEYATGSRVD